MFDHQHPSRILKLASELAHIAKTFFYDNSRLRHAGTAIDKRMQALHHRLPRWLMAFIIPELHMYMAHDTSLYSEAMHGAAAHEQVITSEQCFLGQFGYLRNAVRSAIAIHGR